LKAVNTQRSLIHPPPHRRKLLDKLFEDMWKMAEKNPLVAGILATIFGLYIVGRIETKTISTTSPTREGDVNWASVVMAQNESISTLTKLVTELIDKIDEKELKDLENGKV